MADNTQINVGSGGDIIATDDLGSGIKVQRQKVGFGVDGSYADVTPANPLPVVQTGTPALPTGAATEATLDTRTGALTETAPASDTASSGLNGRLQRIAQRITSLIALIPTALTGSGNFKIAVQEALPTGTNSIGQVSANPITGQTGVQGGAGAVSANTQRVAIASDANQVVGSQVTVDASITRPADTNAYLNGDAWADSTSSPSTPTLTGAARASGKSGIISDIILQSDNGPATLLTGQLFIFDDAVTPTNDNAALSISDADLLKLVGVVDFSLVNPAISGTANSYYHAKNLSIGFTTVGSANLRFLVKVTNGYTPASGEKLTVRAKCVQTN
jgi:hypothetical protein